MLAPPEQTEKHRLRQRYEVECGEEWEQRSVSSSIGRLSEFSSADSAGSRVQHRGQRAILHCSCSNLLLASLIMKHGFVKRATGQSLWTFGHFLLLFSAFLFVNKKKSLNRVWSLTVDLSNSWRFYCIRWLIVNWIHRNMQNCCAEGNP